MFGQVVIGPPGSGKTTYCNAMQQFLTKLGRKVAVLNMDPANDILPYECAVNISDLITLDEVMENLRLGPNGGLLYCMEYLEKNLDWLKERCEKFKDHYLLFDFPGQVELYTHHNSVKVIVQTLVKWDFRLAAVHLVDSHYCSDPSKFIAVLLTSLSSMLQVALPHVNILSKADLIEKCGKLAFNLDFYTEVLDLGFLLDRMQDDPFFAKFKKLNEAVCGVIDDYSLVSYVALDLQDKESMFRAVKTVDQANGYMFNDLEERNMQTLLSRAVGTSEFEYEKIRNIQEKYMAPSSEDAEDDGLSKMES